ncbi:hypothetical protein CAY59_16015 [Vibrio campbellii]|uniref:glycosyltransferase n=1 Tax=Vibrio campbellii TaxID=680 RepID=UPI000A2FD82D|nr:glycosyltransferase family 4 protein [Vibrio campbellii]ARR45726.1 hypothetical protein CAY59_16015 [Vibrio campbellii]
MKVLFLSDSCDFKKGKGVVSKSNLGILNEIYGVHSVSVFCLKGMSGKNDFKMTGNQVFEYQGYQGRYSSLYNLLTLKHNHLSSKIEHEFLKIVDDFDLVFIDDSNFGRLNRLCAQKNIKNVSFFHNIRRDLSKKWLKYYGFKFLPSYLSTLFNESCAVKFSDITITLNERDASLYQKYYKAQPTTILPVQIKDSVSHKDVASHNTSEEIKKRENKEILFVGADYYPNVEGIKWFIEDVLPALPNSTLKIVGFGMEKYKAQFEEAGQGKVDVVGTVDDLGLYYESASIIILPIFEGGGMKVKTAEALMYGSIVVGTKESFVGYEVTNDMFESNSKDEFLENIHKAYNLSEENNGFSKLNRDVYNRNHDFSKGLERIKEVFLS